MNKYRAGKIKREHTVIENIWPVLEHMAQCELITSIIPGPISRLRAREVEVTFQRFTETGLRLLAKNRTAVQEVYVVTPEKEAAVAWLVSEKILSQDALRKLKRKSAAKGSSAGEKAQALKTVKLPFDTVCSICQRPMKAGSRGVQMDKHGYTHAHTRCAKK